MPRRAVSPLGVPAGYDPLALSRPGDASGPAGLPCMCKAAPPARLFVAFRARLDSLKDERFRASPLRMPLRSTHREKGNERRELTLS